MNNETPDEKASLLLRLMEKRRLLGFEKSFKMAENTLLDKRFLLGISKHDVPQDSLFAICERMGLQADYLSAFMDNLQNADIVHFGFEENESGCVYKVYLEYCAKYYSQKDTNKNNTNEPFQLHLAFKWNPLSHKAGTIARYIYHPRLSLTNIFERLSTIYSGAKDKFSFEIAKGIVNAASARLDANNLMYIEVSEEGNPRLSFDIKLYESNLRLCDINDFLSRIRQHYSTPAVQFEHMYNKIKTNRVVHLSGGVDREGKDFFTFYYAPDMS